MVPSIQERRGSILIGGIVVAVGIGIAFGGAMACVTIGVTFVYLGSIRR